jgi:TRAP-type C4-dicarboxylate transport system permease small subunit
MSKVIDRFEVWFNAFNTFIAALVALSIGAFAVLIPIDLLLRKLRWGNFPWLGEGIEYALYVGVFLSAAWVLQKGAHVRVDIIVAALPKRVAVRMEKALDIVGAVLCAVLCYYGVDAAIIEYVDQTLPDKDLRIDNWYMMVAFALAFALLTIEFLLRIRRAGDAGDKAGF